MKKRKIKVGRIIVFLIGVLLVSTLLFLGIKGLFKAAGKLLGHQYLASDTTTVFLYDINYTQVKEVPRGKEVAVSEKIDNEGKEYYKIKLNKEEYLVLSSNLAEKLEDTVLEKELYVRTPVTLYKSNESTDIIGLVKKGEKVSILGYDKLSDDGLVNMYKVKYNDEEGFVYGKYLVNTHELAIANYDEEGNYQIHYNRGDAFGGGDAGNLDYYPYEKPKFKDNVMPDEVRALYLNSGVLDSVDEYIEIAKGSGINAFVVDIKDDQSPGYESEVMKEYSPTNYKYANNSFESYQKAIKKLKDAGFYVIGRITVFKDSYYAQDHPENAIKDNTTGKAYSHDGSYWPSAYKRHVWEFNVKLAIEAVEKMGFNEIQFDYVRFPDRIGYLEEEGIISFGNTYEEDKAQAIQEFVMYACDEIHKYNAYVSIDVFGESAHRYVTAYGQYWAAISNIADVISGMPYPDHFSAYEYGFEEVVWKIPYRLLNLWGEDFVMERQKEIPTPAIVRTWIQAYDTYKSPQVTYDSYMVSQEIQGLYDAGLTGGFMTWNGGSSISKYDSIKSAFGKEY